MAPPDIAEAPAAASPLEDFFENGAVGLHLVAGDGVILRANKAELELLGYSRDEYVGRRIAEFHADRSTIEDILARLGRGETLDKYPARLKAKDGSIKHVLISSSVCFDDEGRFVNTRCFTLDVTERVRTEAQLREAEQRLEATYEHALAAISEVDADGRLLRTNEALARLTGHAREALLGRSVFDITHPDDVAEDRSQFERQVRGELDRYSLEKRYIRSDGAPIWVHVMSTTVRGADGRFLYGVRVATDISELKLAEERSRLWINELNHRVKNTLATVQSFAKQTARSARELDDFMHKFEGRLFALSKAHDRLSRRNWEGASLAEIVREELGLHGGEGRGLTVAGPDVALPPQVALSLSMALHELATNAMKHGAISSPSGAVAVSWSVARDAHSRPRRVDLQWRETDGPPVTAPARRGFGSRLLEALAAELGGEAELAFDPAGLKWRIEFPLP